MLDLPFTFYLISLDKILKTNFPNVKQDDLGYTTGSLPGKVWGFLPQGSYHMLVILSKGSEEEMRSCPGVEQVQTRCVTHFSDQGQRGSMERTAQLSAGAEGGQSKGWVLMHFGEKMSEHEERQDYISAN